MWRRLTAWRSLLFLAAAVLSAVISDLLIETGAIAGLYGPAFADHDHRSVLATSTAGVVLALAAVVVALLEGARARRRGATGQDWFAEAARDISTRWSWRVFPSTLAVAIAVRYAMESAELLRTSGHVATGLDWLGGPLPVALALHAAFCGLMLFVLMVAMQAITHAFNAVVAILIAIVLCARKTSSAFAWHADVRRFIHRRSPLATRLGERAPPLGLAA